MISRQVSIIQSPEFEANPPSTEGGLLLGIPASYWLEVKKYDQVAVAASLKIPIAVLQPGRDYQVTITDDFKKWEEGLQDRATFLKIYHSLNHLLMRAAGEEGLALPGEYELEGHVDEILVKDIVSWIQEHAGKSI